MTATDDALGVAEHLSGLLEQRTRGVPDHEVPDRDWDSFWGELEDGGWLDLAREYVDRSDPTVLVTDLIEICETWGRFLLPLPFSIAAYASHQGVEPTDVVLNSGAGPVVANPGWLPPAGAYDEEDDFAPSLRLRSVRDRGPGIDLSLLLTFLVAEAVGHASTALQLAVQYSTLRSAYGRPIGSYQALQHLMADMLVDVELARTGVRMAAHEKDPRESLLDACTRGREVVTRAIQVFGGIGFTWEVPLHLHLRHVLVVSDLVSHSL